MKITSISRKNGLHIINVKYFFGLIKREEIIEIGEAYVVIIRTGKMLSLCRGDALVNLIKKQKGNFKIDL